MKNKAIAVLGGDKNSRTFDRLRRQGYDIVKVPSVEFESVGLSLRKFRELAAPESYDIVIFADAKAVESLASIIGETSVDELDFDHATIVALGESVADQLRFLQIHSDVIPAKLDPGSVFESIRDYLGGGEAFPDTSILIVASVGTSQVPLEELRQAGCEPETVSLSKKRIDNQKALVKMKALALGGGFDAVYFGSPGDVFEAQVLNDCGLDLFAGGASAICADELTKSALEEIGVEAKLIPQLR